MTKAKPNPQVLILMGSDSDMPTMQKAKDIFDNFEISYEVKICSAHRSPDYLHKIMGEAKDIKVFIAGAGMAAHLAGVVSSLTVRPVIGVPLASGPLSGFDALLSTAQMPPGMPVATMAVDGAKNAAFLALEILAVHDEELTKQLLELRKKTQEDIIAKNE